MSDHDARVNCARWEPVRDGRPLVVQVRDAGADLRKHVKYLLEWQSLFRCNGLAKRACRVSGHLHMGFQKHRTARTQFKEQVVLK